MMTFGPIPSRSTESTALTGQSLAMPSGRNSIELTEHFPTSWVTTQYHDGSVPRSGQRRIFGRRLNRRDCRWQVCYPDPLGASGTSCFEPLSDTFLLTRLSSAYFRLYYAVADRRRSSIASHF